MATISRNGADDDVIELKKRLEAFEIEHPGAKAELYRQNPASIRVRIIADAFKGVPRLSRKELVEKHLQGLDEDVREQITLFLLLPPAEAQHSIMNQEFEDPIPSTL